MMMIRAVVPFKSQKGRVPRVPNKPKYKPRNIGKNHIQDHRPNECISECIEFYRLSFVRGGAMGKTVLRNVYELWFQGIQMTTRKKLCLIKGISEAKMEKIKEAAVKLSVRFDFRHKLNFTVMSFYS